MDEFNLPSIVIPVEFIGAISHANSIESVLMAAAQRLPALVGCEYSVVTFLDDDRQISRAFQREGETRIFGSDTKIYPGTAGATVLETGEPQIVDSKMLEEARKGLMPRMYAAGIRVALIAPMRSGGITCGTLTIASKSEQQFRPQQLEFVLAIGKWIASQARLMQQVRRTAQLAETDGLTGLANRARLMRVLDGPGALHVPDSQGRIVAVLHIDLDHFKEVNDTLGHAAGDAILIHAAKAMQASVGPKDLVARIGGDEFVVTTRTDPQGHHLVALGQKIAHAVTRPVRFGDVEARVGVSMGAALSSPRDNTADRLIGNADMALYEVKRNGRGEVHKFTESMREANEKRIQLISDLAGAIRNRDFEPYFQPQVAFKTGHFSGFEILARWNHPTLGLLDPKEFLELVAESGKSKEVDEIVRRKGLQSLAALRADGWHAPKMSFNTSAKTLALANLIPMLLDEIADENLKAEDLVLEVRERDLAALGRENGVAIINSLSEAGFNVVLDDFGVGLSTISTIARVAVSAIKLDASISALIPDERFTIILKSIITLARDLNLTVIAEGIETPEQFAFLRNMGCDAAQGYGISHPLPLPGLIEFMKGYGQAPVSLAIA